MDGAWAWSALTNIFSCGMEIQLKSLAKWYHIAMRSLRLLLKKRLLRKFVLITAIIISLPVLIFSVYNLSYSSKIFPNISVAGVPVSGLSREEASQLLGEKITIPENINVVGQSKTFKLNTNNLNVTYDFEGSVQNAFNIGRTGFFFEDMVRRLYLTTHSENLSLMINVNAEKLSKFVSMSSGQTSVTAKDPSARIVKGVVVVDRGEPGIEADSELLKSRILFSLSHASSEDVALPIKSIDNTLTETEAVLAKARVEKYIGKSVQLNFEFNTYTLKVSDILKLLDLKGGFNEKSINKNVESYAAKIDRSPQNPRFKFLPAPVGQEGKIAEFAPALDGVEVDREAFKRQLILSLEQLEQGEGNSVSFEIPVIRTPPEVSTDQVNDLGIKELIGRGVSTYFHSSSARVHNIVLAAGNINGTLVKPGETFSFNETLGDVSVFTGYQKAFIISDGKTILGDGGGVCQVSTTLFRAVLNAGLPVPERTSHAYRVSYYEQNSPPGLDATVYGPSPDFKFTNDTPAYILIVANTDPKKYSLVFEIYGSNDGRVAIITKPVISNISPPPEDLYQDDPTLKTGTVKQIDFKAWGARVVFNYTVSRNNEQIYSRSFVSNYRPWQAVYLRGTGPAD